MSTRLIDAVERDAVGRPPAGLDTLAGDLRRQQLLVGAWIGDEIGSVNEDRLRDGLRPLDQAAEQRLRARVVAELTGRAPSSRT